VKETQHTVVFEVSAGATKTQIKEAVQQIFKVKVAGVRTAILSARCAAAARTKGYRRDWKKGVRQARRRRKDDRSNAENL